jgi:hypothetical protein
MAFLLVLLSVLSAASAAKQFIPASNGAIWYTGRFLVNPDGTRSFDWLCTIHVNVQYATYVRAYFNSTGGARGRFQTIIDGRYELSSFYVGAQDDANATEGSWLVASGGLGGQPRLVQIRNVLEPAMENVGPDAYFTFIGLELDGNVANASPKARSIELLGDSISAGFGSRGSAAQALNCVDVDINNSGQTYTYGAMLADMFAADLSNIAWSCKGMLLNCDGTKDNMPMYYQRTFAGRPATDAASTWGFPTVPNLLIINLGTNDMHNESPTFDVELTHQFVSFWQNTTARYKAPQLPVALLYGPM